MSKLLKDSPLTATYCFSHHVQSHMEGEKISKFQVMVGYMPKNQTWECCHKWNLTYAPQIKWQFIVFHRCLYSISDKVSFPSSSKGLRNDNIVLRVSWLRHENIDPSAAGIWVSQGMRTWKPAGPGYSIHNRMQSPLVKILNIRIIIYAM